MSLNFSMISELQDFQILEELARRIWEEHYTPIIGEDQVSYMMEKFQQAEVMQRQAAHEDYRYYLVYYQSRIAGYFSFKTMDRDLFLSKFYLEKEFRGKGLARQMMEFIENRAAEAGLERISLTVNKNNLNSIAAYQAMGFDVTEPVVIDIGGGFVMDDFRMMRNLV